MDVPAKLAARVRLFDTGWAARLTRWVRTRSRSSRCALRVLKLDAQLEALRMLTDRREALTRHRVQSVNRLHAMGLAGLVLIEAKMKKAGAELKATVLGRGSRLMDLHGVGPVEPPGSWLTTVTSRGSVIGTASRPGPAPHQSTRPQASKTGTGSPGPGNRRMNTCSTSPPSPRPSINTRHRGQGLLPTQTSRGQDPTEALRCLKRRISDALPPTDRRRRTSADDTSPATGWHRSGRALRGVSKIQHG